jgi:hypothetical protein
VKAAFLDAFLAETALIVLAIGIGVAAGQARAIELAGAARTEQALVTILVDLT